MVHRSGDQTWVPGNHLHRMRRVRPCRSFVGSRFGSRYEGGARVLLLAAGEHLHHTSRVGATSLNCLQFSSLLHPITHQHRYIMKPFYTESEAPVVLRKAQRSFC
jgi:hypothetical protein